jgi:lipoate-protein ligase B
MLFKIFDLGLINFQKAEQFQKEVFKAVKNNFLKSALILCQYYPVITLGRQAKKLNIKASGEELKRRGIPLYEIERGGDVTYHGPGQLMVYPILNLDYFKRDIHLFLRRLEGLAMQVLSDFGIFSQSQPGLTGVWVENEKIASIGIAIRNWITYYGLAINIKRDDLSNFSLIRPCGMDIKMTSLESMLDKNVNIEDVKTILLQEFKDSYEIVYS